MMSSGTYVKKLYVQNNIFKKRIPNMRFWITYNLVQISVFEGLLKGISALFFFSIFHRRPTVVANIFSQLAPPPPPHPSTHPQSTIKKATNGLDRASELYGSLRDQSKVSEEGKKWTWKWRFQCYPMNNTGVRIKKAALNVFFYQF